jgi:site-specific DNA-methyltransferase (adenine-specific)
MKTNHKVIIGDCLEELKKLPEESVDMVFADPPYGLAKKKGLGWKYSKHITLQETWDIFSKDEFFDFNIKWLTEAMRVLKHGGSLWVCGSFHNIYQLGFILQHLDAKINNSIVWFKPNAQPNITCRMFTESTEHLIWAVKNHSKTKWTFNYDLIKSMNNGKQMRNLWEIPLTPKSEKWAGVHPTQKPIELVRRAMLACTNEGALVLDPFLGSGTTSAVAKMLGRNSIGIEKDKKYLPFIKKRMDPPQKTMNEMDAKVQFIDKK